MTRLSRQYRPADLAILAKHYVMSCVAAFTLAAVFPAVAQPSNDINVWLKRRCLDKGTADHPLQGADFEACLRKQIERLPALDRNKREFFGEKYDPNEYVRCRLRPNGRNDGACDVYILLRREWPEYWPDTAKRIKWPEPPKESVYRRGMKPKEYWEALCKAEASESISKHMTEVPGVLEIRPRSHASDEELSDLYVLEGAFLSTDILNWPRPEHALVQPYGGRYEFLERYVGSKHALERIVRINPAQAKERWQTAREGRFVMVPKIIEARAATTPTAKYGYTWRGITRAHDRENGISGGELAIVNLATGEPLGIRRGFSFSDPSRPTRLRWASAVRCPQTESAAPNASFMYQVLRPRAGINDAIVGWEK